MARIKYFNPETGKWEYADSQYPVGSGGYDVMLRFDTPEGTNLWDDALEITKENLTLVSGDVSALETKWKNGEPVKVGVILHTYYWSTEYHGFTEVLGCVASGSGFNGLFFASHLPFGFFINNDGTTNNVTKKSL